MKILEGHHGKAYNQTFLRYDCGLDPGAVGSGHEGIFQTPSRHREGHRVDAWTETGWNGGVCVCVCVDDANSRDYSGNMWKLGEILQHLG